MMYNLTYIKEVLTAQQVPSHKLTQTDTASYELFFVKGKLETVRRTDTCELSLTVYAEHDGKTGSSTVQIYPSFTEEELIDAIRRAEARALLVYDEPYTLPEGGCESYAADGALIASAPETIAADIADAVFGAEAPKGATINALEVFVKDVRERVINSCGVDKTQAKRTASFEYIPTYNGEEGSVELYQFETIAAFDGEALRAEVSEHMADVAARMQAKAPTSPLACPVLLPAREIYGLVRTLAYDLSFSAAYNHSNLHQLGDDIQKSGIADKLTVTALAQAAGSAAGAHFDADGTTLIDRTLIKDGVCVGRFGSHRFAQYLGEAATGALPCLRVEAGSTPAEQLRALPHLAVVSMSGLQVDLFNDYIGGEIRLAYYVDGATKTPVTGISFSGTLTDALRTLTLSRECTTRGAYVGPALARIDDMKIF